MNHLYHGVLRIMVYSDESPVHNLSLDVFSMKCPCFVQICDTWPSGNQIKVHGGPLSRVFNDRVISGNHSIFCYVTLGRVPSCQSVIFEEFGVICAFITITLWYCLGTMSIWLWEYFFMHSQRRTSSTTIHSFLQVKCPLVCWAVSSSAHTLEILVIKCTINQLKC